MSAKHMTLTLATLVVLASLATAADKAADTAAPAANDKVDKNPVATTTATHVSNDYGIPHNLMNILTNGGAVALGVIVVAALAALAMPMFNIRLCQILGNCENSYMTGNTASGYSANSMYPNDVYGQYPQASYPSSNTYQKRSVDYMSPVIHMLKTAYDKYGQNSLHGKTAL